ncbi:MAG: tRNA lysidine(34) synthetase TilS, partial [Gammaproteobacteria bacterium]|nr:tRNA lysidine(34) synthetase TilS [Gammaproteobacteria bacterium]
MSKVTSSALDIIERQIKPLLPNKFCIAFSGGVDSTVLLHAIKNIIDEKSQIRAIHINHNIVGNSKVWAKTCKSICKNIGIDIEIISLEVTHNGYGLEAAARDERYKKLKEILYENEYLLTAHHEEDQMETVFLRMARGTGLDGLQGINEKYSFGEGIIFRPMLEVSKTSVMDYAKEHQLKWVEDSSNQDTHFDRNFLRKKIIPQFRERWPSIASSVSRLSQLSAQNIKILNQIAEEDIGPIANMNELPLAKLLDKSFERANNMLRYIILANGMSIPSMKTLQNGLKEILDPETDKSVIAWKDYCIRKYKNHLYFLRSSDLEPNKINVRIPWEIGKAVNLGENIGTIEATFIHGDGLSIEKCENKLTISYRQGGESIKPIGHRINKSLKKLFQENQILPWMRDKIHLIYYQDELVSGADLWFNQNYVAAPNEDGFVVNWHKKMLIK